MLTEIVNGVEVPTARPVRLDAPIARRFVELTADVNGPTLVRIWDAPKSTYAQRFRHSIEPFAQVLYRTAIDNYNAIPKLESADSIVGSATSYTYGMNTRFYAKRTVDGPRAIPREVISAIDPADLQYRCALGAVGCRPAVAQQRADVALHAGAGARAHVAVRWRDGHVQNRLRRTIQPFQELQRRCRVGTRAHFAHRELEQRALPAGRPSARTSRARPTTSTPSRTCGFSRTATASRTRSTGTSSTSR